MQRTETACKTDEEFLAAYQPVEPVSCPHGTLARRFDLAAQLLASGPTEEQMEIVIGLTLPRGMA